MYFKELIEEQNKIYGSKYELPFCKNLIWDPINQPGFLFEVTVTNSDSLPLPYVVAQAHLPLLLSTERLIEHNIPLTDSESFLWDLGYIPFEAEQAFILGCHLETQSSLWAVIMGYFGIRPGDRVLFFMPQSPQHRIGPTHFCIQHIPQPQNALPINNVNFVEQNFLFEKLITEWDAAENAFEVNHFWAQALFPNLDTREGNRELAKFTDHTNKVWYIEVEYVTDWDVYLLTHGWSQFMMEYGLEAGDLVEFYTPEFETHNKHFLIRV